MNTLKLARARRLAGLLAVCASLPGLVSPARGQQPAEAVIFDMDTARHRPTTFGEKKTPAGTVEVVDGKFARACRFSFAPGAQSGFFAAGVKATLFCWDKVHLGKAGHQLASDAVLEAIAVSDGQR